MNNKQIAMEVLKEINYNLEHGFQMGSDINIIKISYAKGLLTAWKNELETFTLLETQLEEDDFCGGGIIIDRIQDLKESIKTLEEGLK